MKNILDVQMFRVAIKMFAKFTYFCINLHILYIDRNDWKLLVSI